MGCEDEATFVLIPTVARGWARKGSKPVAIIDKIPKAINVFGFRTAKTFTFNFSKKKNQHSFTYSLKKAIQRYRHLLLFADYAPGHHGKIVNAFLNSHRKTFKLEHFPHYTPELNPCEQCWKPARKKLTTKTLHTIPAMQYHLRQTFNNTKNLPKMFEYLGD